MPRKAGLPNKNKRGLKAQLKQEYGDDFDVIFSMAKNIVRMQELADNEGDPEAEFSQRKECVASLEKIAQYIEPKLKAVEVTGSDGESLFPASIKIVHE